MGEEVVDFLVVPEIDRLYVLGDKGTVFVFISSTGQLTSHHNFSTSQGNFFIF